MKGQINFGNWMLLFAVISGLALIGLMVFNCL